MYVEKIKRNKNLYFYLVENIRHEKGWKKIRIYIGKNLTKNSLEKLKKTKTKDLAELVEKKRLLSDPLLSLISKSEEKIIKAVKERYMKDKKKMDRFQYENLYERFITEFTYDTNAIEGSTVNLQETGLILFDKIVPEGKTIKEINEVQNHKEAFDYMLKYKGDINKNFVLKLHKLLMHNVLWKYAGNFRDVQVYVRGAQFIPPPPENVEKEFKDLMLWYRSNKKKYNPVIISGCFHHKFESIHPFRDGNGRIGRLLLNFVLRKNGLPMINIKYRERGKYYQSLESGNKGDLKPLVSLIIKYLEESESSL